MDNTLAPLWAEINQQAQALAGREPILEHRLRQRILRWTTPDQLLAATLAAQLAQPDLAEEALFELFFAVLTDNPNIIQSATHDVAAVINRDPGTPSALHVVLNQKGYHALQAHRLCHALWKHERRDLAFTLANAVSRTFAVDIHPAARIGHGVMFDHATGIVIGETTIIGNDVSILQHVTLGGTGKESGDRHPKVRDGVLLGAGSTVLGNIEIGHYGKVAAGSVVLTSVPAHCTVAGVPARIVRRLDAATIPGLDMNQSI